jgi:HK97 family phage major capsid protein
MHWKKLLEQAQKKAAAAKAILEGDEPNVEEAKKLLAEAEALREQAKALKMAGEIEAEADAQIKAFDAAAREPATNSGLVVGDGEIDRKIKAAVPLYGSLGAFLIDLASGADRPELRAIKGGPEVENGYDLVKAIGEARVGSVNPRTNKALCDAHKAISGMSETVPVDGGILVGTDTDTNIMGRVYNVGSLLGMVQTIPISGNANSMTFFREAETSRATGSRRGGIRFYWAAEGDTKTSSKPAFERLQLTLHKAIGLVYATDELLQDASALESWIMENLPEELRFGVEASMLAGTGAGQPQGIIGANCTISVPKETGQTADTVVAENIIKMWSRRWVANTDYVWLIHQSVEPQLHQLSLSVGTGGQLVYMPPGGLAGGMYGSLYARPVMSTEYNPALGDNGDIILWSPREYLMIDKGGVQSASSIHVRFINDETTFRFVLRIDGKTKWSSALTPYAAGSTTPPTVSPIITLAERA